MSEEKIKGPVSHENLDYHLKEFIKYVGAMERSLSSNWDRFNDAQGKYSEKMVEMVDRLGKYESVHDIAESIESLKAQQKEAESVSRSSYQDARNVFNQFTRKLDEFVCHLNSNLSEVGKYTQQIRSIVQDFQTVEVRKIAKQAAMEALFMLDDFRKNFEYLEKAREVLSEVKQSPFTHVPNNRFLALTPDEAELSVRTTNLLNSIKIESMGELMAFSEEELLKYRNTGRKSLNELKVKFKENNITWPSEVSCKR